MAGPVRITIEDLTQKVEEGWKKDALAEHYGLPMTQMGAALKQAGLRIRKFHKPKFELIGITPSVIEEEEVFPIHVTTIPLTSVEIATDQTVFDLHKDIEEVFFDAEEDMDRAYERDLAEMDFLAEQAEAAEEAEALAEALAASMPAPVSKSEGW